MGDAIDTTEILQRFDADGYAAVRQFVHGAELDDFINNDERIITNNVPGFPREHVFYGDINDGTTLKPIQHMGQDDPCF